MTITIATITTDVGIRITIGVYKLVAILAIRASFDPQLPIARAHPFESATRRYFGGTAAVLDFPQVEIRSNGPLVQKEIVAALGDLA
jgi:hypothetical protein